MPTETYYADPVTGERLQSNRPSDAYTADKNDPRLDVNSPLYDPNVVYDPAYTGFDAYTDDANGAPRPVPSSHATVSELNEMKMRLGSKHTALAMAVAELSQAQTAAEFAATKAKVMAKAADIRNHVQGFKS